MKLVEEMRGAKAAYVILNRKGQHVSTVRANWSDNRNGAVCTVQVLNFAPYSERQSASAGGGGYDKFTSALARLTVDGIRMSDHCGMSLKPPRGQKLFPADYKPRKGYRLANYIQGERAASYGLPDGASGYLSCYRDDGLRYLEALGYRVIQAL